MSCLRAVGGDVDWPSRSRCFRWCRGARLSAASSVTFSTVVCTATSAGIGAGKWKVGGDEGILDEDGPGGGEIDLLPDAGVAIADGGQPVPADGGEEGGAIDGGYRRRFCPCRRAGCARGRSPGWGCGETRTAMHGFVAGCDVVSDVELAADEGAAGGADLLAVDPDLRGVVDAVEVEPDVLAGVAGGNGEPRCGTTRRCGRGSRGWIRDGCFRRIRARDRYRR